MAEEIASNETSTTSGNSYTVVSGDSLYAIARKTGTSIQDLLSLNGLNLNSIIHPGQVLALSSKSATTETKQEESASKEEKANEETTNEETSTSTKQSSSSGTYTVVSGDGLYAIARKTGTSIDDLLSLNGLSLTSTIYPGQVLTLSANSQEAESEESSSTENESSTSTQETSSEENAASSEQTSTGGTYTVVSGDGLYAIARKTGTSIDDLLSLNGLSLNSTIYPGQVLTLSGNSESAPAAESTESTAEESQEEVATPEETTPSTNAKMYYVHSGDSLYRIAHNHGISLSTY